MVAGVMILAGATEHQQLWVRHFQRTAILTTQNAEPATRCCATLAFCSIPLLSGFRSFAIDRRSEFVLDKSVADNKKGGVA